MITVTILILIDGFLQYRLSGYMGQIGLSHNPYFNRWFSAITNQSRPPYHRCHNPYFNRWFSAIMGTLGVFNDIQIVTILILIDGFLQ